MARFPLALLIAGCSLPCLAADEVLTLDAVLTLAQEVQVPARESGVLAEVFVQPGDAVELNQTLARLDDLREKVLHQQAKIELHNAQRQAHNDLKVSLARKTHEVAAAELKRAAEAAERFSKSVSQTELDRLRLESERTALEIDQAQFDLETAALTVEAKQSALQLAELELTRRVVAAPTAGIVVELLQQPGEWVEPGQPLLRLVRIDRLRAEGFLPAQDASPRLVGKAVAVAVKLGDGKVVTLSGKLTFVSPEIHPVNNMARVWAEVENREGLLRPGLQATLRMDR